MGCQSIIHFRRRRKKYFKQHDEYEILKGKFRNDRNFSATPTFGVHIGICSDGNIYVYDKEDNDKRQITIDELKLLLAMDEKLKAYEQELCKQVNIEFQKKSGAKIWFILNLNMQML